MRYQNKSLYTRRFNQLKAALRAHFGESVEMHDTASLRWGPEACIVAHDGSLGFELWFRDESGESQFVQIAKTPYCSKAGLVGIHVRETNFAHILDQIDVALRDGFESIYVESLSKVKGA